MILHTLAASPSCAAFDNCLRLAAPGDAILLLGDGVYAALADTGPLAQLASCGAEVFMLRADAAAAGVPAQAASVTTVDMDGFVALSERFPRQLAWY